MGIKRGELVTLKNKIKAEMLRRNGKGSNSRLWTPSIGFGSLEVYGGSGYDFTHAPVKDTKVYAEYGEKTVDLLLKVRNYPDLAPTVEGTAIPTGFNSGLLQRVDDLAAEQFTGETLETVAARKAAGEANIATVESSSCNAACSGLCVGSCIGMCNGCYSSCTSSCGTGCESGSMVPTKTAVLCNACTFECAGGCTGTCGLGCAGSGGTGTGGGP